MENKEKKPRSFDVDPEVQYKYLMLKIALNREDNERFKRYCQRMKEAEKEARAVK